jgi:hypothetical protein
MHFSIFGLASNTEALITHFRRKSALKDGHMNKTE